MKLPINYDEADWRTRKTAREQYIQEQGGKCMFCRHHLSGDPPEKIREIPIDLNLFPPNFLKYSVHLHHNHETGMTIGAVHSVCNAILFQYYGE